MSRDRYSERVPFRLTRMLLHAMEAGGIEGSYRSTFPLSSAVFTGIALCVSSLSCSWLCSPPSHLRGSHARHAREQGLADGHAGGVRLRSAQYASNLFLLVLPISSLLYLVRVIVFLLSSPHAVNWRLLTATAPAPDGAGGSSRPPRPVPDPEKNSADSPLPVLTAATMTGLLNEVRAPSELSCLGLTSDCSSICQRALSVLTRVSKKLTGKDFGPTPLNVPHQGEATLRVFSGCCLLLISISFARSGAAHSAGDVFGEPMSELHGMVSLLVRRRSGGEKERW
jgi:hypothetical protein